MPIPNIIFNNSLANSWSSNKDSLGYYYLQLYRSMHELHLYYFPTAITKFPILLFADQ